MKYLFPLLLTIIISIPMLGQEESKDLGSWSAVQLNYKAGDKVTLKAKPIVRHKSDLGDYDNSSIDLAVAYKINAQWSVQALHRIWFLPNNTTDRQFYFFDLNQKVALSDKITLTNKLRYHLALDITRNDVDFLRYQPSVTFNTGTKFTPYLGYSMFYRLTEESGVAGARYKLGFSYKFTDKAKVEFTYWNQEDYNEKFSLPNAHLLVVNLNCNLN